MSEVIGKIAHLDGKFYARAEDGSLRELSKGDALYVGEIVIGDAGNDAIDSVIVSLNDGNDIVVLADQSQAFDQSLTQNEFTPDETVSQSSSILSMLEASGDITAEDIEAIETAAGEEGAPDSTGGMPARFAVRNDDEGQDLNVALKDAAFGEVEGNPKDEMFDELEELRRANTLLSQNENTETTITTTDTTAPDAPTVTVDELTNNGTTTVKVETEAGAEVVIKDANGNEIGSGTADEDGVVNIEVTLPEGENQITVTATDAAGNESSATTGTITVDTEAEAGTVTVNDIAGDNVINNAESQNPTTTVSGTATGGDIAAGDTVTVSVNGNDYTTTVDEDGNYSVEVATSDLIADGTVDVSVESSDDAGNTVTTTGATTVAVTVDTEAEAGTVTVNDIAGDNVINNAESQNPTTTVSGTATGGDIAAGDTVTVSVNGNDYTTTVDEDGNYSVEVATSDLIADGTVDVSVESSDDAGNTVTTTGATTVAVTVDTEAEAGTVTVNDIAGDNVINNAESQNPTTTVSGTATGGDIAAGDTVTVSVNGNDYTTTVDEDGNYSVEVATSDLIADGTVDVSVESSDDAGNTVTTTGATTVAVTVDTEAEAGTVTVNDIAGDNVINNAESQNPTTTVSGTATGGDIAAGDTVTVSVNGNDYTTTVDEDGNYSVEVATSDLIADGTVDVSVESSDDAGNTVTTTGATTVAVTVDTEAEAGTVTVNDIAGDNVINNAESQNPTTTVSGTATGGDIAAGDTVTVSVNGNDYTTTVDEDGNYSVEVATSDLIADGTVDVSVESSDDAGNTVTTTGATTVAVTVDTEAEAGTVTVNDIAGDNVINNAESQNPTTTVSGTATGGDIAAGDTVTVSVNGNDYTTTVDEDGNYSVEVATSDLIADGTVDVSVESSDDAGNTVTTTGATTVAVTVDTEAEAGTVTVNDIAGDNVINNAESQNPTTTVSGTATGGDIAAGDTVTVSVNGNDYTTTVDEDGNYSVEVATSDLIADGTVDVSVESSDDAGNTVTTTGATTVAVTVDTEAEAGTVTVNDIAGDNVINNAESQNPTTTVSGTATGGDIAAGDTVTVSVNGNDYTTTVDEDGNYSVEVATSDLIADGTVDVSVESSDDAGNTVTTTGATTVAVTVDTEAEAGTVTVNDIAGDNVINNAESQNPTTTVSGTATGGDIAAGDTVTVSVNGNDYTTTVDEDGNYSVEVATSDLIADGTVDVSVESSDDAGNTVTTTGATTVAVTVDTEAEAGTVTVNDIAGDNVINNAESQNPTTTVSGTATGGDIAAGDTVTVSVNGNDYTTTVDEDGNYSVEVATSDLIADGTVDVSVESSDDAGNTVTTTGATTVAVTVDTEAEAGTVTVNDIAGDNVINNAESQNPTTTVSGTATGGDIAAGDTVTVSVNGNDYTTTVDEDGNYSVEVATSDLIADGTVDVSVESSDDAGNTVTTTGATTVAVTVDTEAEAGTVTVNDIAGDNVINNAESQNPTTTVSGTATGGDIAAGDTVTVSVNGNDYTTTVDEDGNYSVEVATSDLIADGTVDVSVESSDDAGNTVTTTGATTVAVTVDTEAEAGTVTVNDIAGDNVINNAESQNPTTTVSGTATGGDIAAGDTVTVSVNGNDYTTTVDEDGNYSVEVATSDLIADGTVDVSVESSDDAGNTVTTTGATTVAVTVDTEAEAGTVTVNDIAGDNVINNAESQNPTTTVSGTATGGDIAAGDTVTVSVNGNDYTTTVDEDGNYSVEVATSDLIADGTVDVSVESSDDAGNTVTTTGATTVAVTVDTEVETPVITNITDAEGDYTNVTLHGTGTPGETITLYAISNSTTGGNDTQTGQYVAIATASPIIVAADGSWSVDISNLNDVPLNDNEFFKATQTDAAGNVSAESNTVHYWHGTWNNVATEAGDDFVVMGGGNDTLRINADDANNTLVVDGGDGTDKIIVDGKFDDYTLSQNTEGSLLLQGANDDVYELRNVESISFGDGIYDTQTGVFADSLISAPTLDMSISDATQVTELKTVIDEEANSTNGIYEREGDFYTTQMIGVPTSEIDVTALRELGYTTDGEGNFFVIDEDKPKVLIEQELTREVTKIVNVDPIMKVATETTTFMSLGESHVDEGLTLNYNATKTFMFAEATSNIEIDFASFDSGKATISFVDANGAPIGSSIVQNSTNDSQGYSVPEGAMGVVIKNNKSSSFDVETISYRGIDHEVTVEAGGLVPDLDAMAAAGITWSETESQTIVQTADILNIGNVGNAEIDGFNPEDHALSQVFNFGSELANRMVTITVDMKVEGSWDNSARTTNDYFSVSANGKEIDVNYYSSTNGSWESADVSYIGDDEKESYTYEYEVFLDDKGQVQLDFMVASTDWREIVNVHNIEVVYEGQTGWVQEVTETETYTQSVLVDAPAQEVDASQIPGGIPYVMTEQEVEVATQPFTKEVAEVVGYTYTLTLAAQAGDDSETLSDLVLNNLPLGTTLQDADGNVIVPNENNVYSLTPDADGVTNFTLVSENELSENELSDITASVTATESNGGASITVSTNVEGDDVIEFDNKLESIDGGEGNDTLLITGNQEIDFSGLSEHISNIETIKLGEGKQEISLRVEDVFEMTDANHTLRIDSDAADSVNLVTEQDWKLGDNITIDDETYAQYTAQYDEDTTVTVQIQVHTEES